ncbi:Amyloid-beta A4 precursor protein-binding A member 1 [Mactra antiquata]
MSDVEEGQHSVNTEHNSLTEIVEGACGGESGLRPSTPFSENGDNLSMEVRFSEGSSHHASDISSVSYQNLLDDDTCAPDLSRRDSADSIDSYLHEYSDDIPPYSSSESDSQCQKSVEGVDERENNRNVELIDTDGYHRQQSPDSNVIPNCINEDFLTEIPLNGPDSVTVIGEDGKLFTLSPENTECDSVEIESVVSDGDDGVTGMPNVEDGLSSSQASDAEDGGKSEHNTPKKILQKKQQDDVERKLYGLDCGSMKPKEMDAEAIMDDLKMKREALDHAISEIKSAIQKSKGVSMEAPTSMDAEEEPVWVKREENIVIPKGGSTYEIVNGQNTATDTTTYNTEVQHKTEDQVYNTDNENDRLLDKQYTKHDGKVYHTPRGYDSDDEYDEDEPHYTRRNHGKKYTQLAKEDSQEYTTSHNQSYDSSQLRVDSVSMYGDSNSYTFTQDSHSDRRNSESLPSSEDFNSDSEIPTKHIYVQRKEGDFDTDEETDQLLGKQYQGNQYVDIPELSQPPVNRSAQAEKRKSRAKEVQINDPDNPSVLIEGVLFRARYLGSTQLISEGQPSKAMRMMQAQEAVGRIKAPEGENQPSTEVDLFVSTEKIMVLNTDLQEIMMDHSLRTISYIADIGEILVIMARRRLIGSPGDTDSMRIRKQAKIICHVFESDEARRSEYVLSVVTVIVLSKS